MAVDSWTSEGMDWSSYLNVQPWHAKWYEALRLATIERAEALGGAWADWGSLAIPVYENLPQSMLINYDRLKAVEDVIKELFLVEGYWSEWLFCRKLSEPATWTALGYSAADGQLPACTYEYAETVADIWIPDISRDMLITSDTLKKWFIKQYRILNQLTLTRKKVKDGEMTIRTQKAVDTRESVFGDAAYIAFIADVQAELDASAWMSYEEVMALPVAERPQGYTDQRTGVGFYCAQYLSEPMYISMYRNVSWANIVNPSSLSAAKYSLYMCDADWNYKYFVEGSYFNRTFNHAAATDVMLSANWQRSEMLGSKTKVVEAAVPVTYPFNYVERYIYTASLYTPAEYPFYLLDYNCEGGFKFLPPAS